MSCALDSNIIIYAFDEADPDKHRLAGRLLDHALKARWPIARQVLGEVLNAAHKKQRLSLPDARRAVELIEIMTAVPPVDAQTTLAASELADRYNLQYFDAVICTIARRGGASILFSEDMHDGLRLGTMTIVNPFSGQNSELVQASLSP